MNERKMGSNLRKKAGMKKGRNRGWIFRGKTEHLKPSMLGSRGDVPT